MLNLLPRDYPQRPRNAAKKTCRAPAVAAIRKVTWPGTRVTASLARKFSGVHPAPIVLAGGLRPGNVFRFGRSSVNVAERVLTSWQRCPPLTPLHNHHIRFFLAWQNSALGSTVECFWCFDPPPSEFHPSWHWMSGLHQKKRSGYEQIDLTSFQSQEDLTRSARRDSIPTVASHAQDNMSINSAAPLHQQNNPIDTSYPPVSNPPSAGLTPVHERRVQFSHTGSDVEANKEGALPSEMPTPNPSPGPGHTGKSPSWDLLAGYKKFEHSYEEFDTRKASEKHLVFADGDVPNTAVSVIFIDSAIDLTFGEIVCPTLPLSFECFNYHPLAYFYYTCARVSLDSWNSPLHNLP